MVSFSNRQRAMDSFFCAKTQFLETHKPLDNLYHKGHPKSLKSCQRLNLNQYLQLLYLFSAQYSDIYPYLAWSIYLILTRDNVKKRPSKIVVENRDFHFQNVDFMLFKIKTFFSCIDSDDRKHFWKVTYVAYRVDKKFLKALPVDLSFVTE